MVEPQAIGDFPTAAPGGGAEPHEITAFGMEWAGLLGLFQQPLRVMETLRCLGSSVTLPRRSLLQAFSLVWGVLGGTLGEARPAQASDRLDSPVQDPQLLERLQACTPQDPLRRLQEGNVRFAAAWRAAAAAPYEQRMEPLSTLWSHTCQIAPQALAQGQRPFAAVLSCADSRVDPGWLFDCASGEIYQVRSAGNTAFDQAIASLDYAVGVLGVSLVLVLGHSRCGAVQAAMSDAPLTPLLEDLVEPIRAQLRSGDDLTRAVERNARHVAAQLTARSALLQDAVAAGRLRVRSAYCDIGSGVVTLL
jgi:carbonic anhydrase